jgi:hypothetical protein
MTAIEGIIAMKRMYRELIEVLLAYHAREVCRGSCSQCAKSEVCNLLYLIRTKLRGVLEKKGDINE